jgi:energy-coupling factor transport system substrate-specific component
VLFSTVYLISCIVSGAVLAGVVSWLLTRGLARTGVLSRFAAGREGAERV